MHKMSTSLEICASFETVCNTLLTVNIEVLTINSTVMLFRIPSSHPNLQTFPQFVWIQIHGLLAAVNDRFKTISWRPDIKRYGAQMHITRCTAITNATMVIVPHTSLKSSAHPRHLQYFFVKYPKPNPNPQIFYESARIRPVTIFWDP